MTAQTSPSETCNSSIAACRTVFEERTQRSTIVASAVCGVAGFAFIVFLLVTGGASPNSTQGSSLTLVSAVASIDNLTPDPAVKPVEMTILGNWTEPRDSNGLMHRWVFKPNGSFVTQSVGGRGSLASSGAMRVEGNLLFLEGKMVVVIGGMIRHKGFSDVLEILDATTLRRPDGTLIRKNGSH